MYEDIFGRLSIVMNMERSSKMKWIDKTNTFSKRQWKDKYLEVCEVLDDKIECNLYS